MPEETDFHGRDIDRGPGKISFTKMGKPASGPGDAGQDARDHVPRRPGRPRGRPPLNKRHVSLSPAPHSSVSDDGHHHFERRHNLDDLIAATEVVEAAEAAPPTAPAPAEHSDRKLLSSSWEDLLPTRADLLRLSQVRSTYNDEWGGPLDGVRGANTAAAPSNGLARYEDPAVYRRGRGLLPGLHADSLATLEQQQHVLRRAVTNEAAMAPPQACFLLPAGTPLDRRLRYVVTPCIVDPLAEHAGKTISMVPAEEQGGTAGLPHLVVCSQAAHPSPASGTTLQAPCSGLAAGAGAGNTTDGSQLLSDTAAPPQPAARDVGPFPHALIAPVSSGDASNGVEGDTRAALHPALGLQVCPKRDVSMAGAVEETPGCHISTHEQPDVMEKVAHASGPLSKPISLPTPQQVVCSTPCHALSSSLRQAASVCTMLPVAC
jgi:hypothetical protein